MALNFPFAVFCIWRYIAGCLGRGRIWRWCCSPRTGRARGTGSDPCCSAPLRWSCNQVRSYFNTGITQKIRQIWVVFYIPVLPGRRIFYILLICSRSGDTKLMQSHRNFLGSVCRMRRQKIRIRAIFEKKKKNFFGPFLKKKIAYFSWIQTL